LEVLAALERACAVSPDGLASVNEVLRRAGGARSGTLDALRALAENGKAEEMRLGWRPAE
jgi:hypothetical protein